MPAIAPVSCTGANTGVCTTQQSRQITLDCGRRPSADGYIQQGLQREANNKTAQSTGSTLGHNEGYGEQFADGYGNAYGFENEKKHLDRIQAQLNDARRELNKEYQRLYAQVGNSGGNGLNGGYQVYGD